MKVRVYWGGDEKEDYVLEKMYDGCPYQKSFVPLDEYEPSDIAVVMGVFKKHVPRSFKRGHVIEEQKKNGATVVVVETGFLNRGDGRTNHYAVGLNGLNGRGEYRNRNSPPDRREKLGVILEPWKQGEHILLCGQVPWDASVDFTDHRKWLEQTARALALHSSRTVVFRPHPKCQMAPIPDTVYSCRQLGQDLMDAWAVVTFNSNTAVEAVIQGIPVFAADVGSMAMPVANADLSRIETPDMPDREQWLNDLCYTQWTPEEMKEGLPWKHLFSR
jgi:hypothetical protein